MIPTKEAFQYIQRLQIKALRNVNDLFAGIYRSTFKGTGLEFEEVREYAPGDDIRSIDWNVTARSQRPYVKNFREERELTVLLAVDISASSRFGHIERFKSELIAELAALIAFSAIKNQDKVGLLLFTNEIELYLKPKKGVRHVCRVIRELLHFTPKHSGTDLQKALAFLSQVQRKKVICFLFSDFLTADFKLQANLLAKRHELIVFHVYDTYEKLFEPKAFFSLLDLETSEHNLVDTSNPKVQQYYKQNADKHALTIKQLFEKIGGDYMTVHTGESSVVALQRFFRSRKRKR